MSLRFARPRASGAGPPINAEFTPAQKTKLIEFKALARGLPKCFSSAVKTCNDILIPNAVYDVDDYERVVVVGDLHGDVHVLYKALWMSKIINKSEDEGIEQIFKRCGEDKIHPDEETKSFTTEEINSLIGAITDVHDDIIDGSKEKPVLLIFNGDVVDPVRHRIMKDNKGQMVMRLPNAMISKHDLMYGHCMHKNSEDVIVTLLLSLVQRLSSVHMYDQTTGQAVDFKAVQTVWVLGNHEAGSLSSNKHDREGFCNYYAPGNIVPASSEKVNETRSNGEHFDLKIYGKDVYGNVKYKCTDERRRWLLNKIHETAMIYKEPFVTTAIRLKNKYNDKYIIVCHGGIHHKFVRDSTPYYDYIKNVYHELAKVVADVNLSFPTDNITPSFDQYANSFMFLHLVMQQAFAPYMDLLDNDMTMFEKYLDITLDKLPEDKHAPEGLADVLNVIKTHVSCIEIVNMPYNNVWLDNTYRFTQTYTPFWCRPITSDGKLETSSVLNASQTMNEVAKLLSKNPTKKDPKLSLVIVAHQPQVPPAITCMKTELECMNGFDNCHAYCATDLGMSRSFQKFPSSIDVHTVQTLEVKLSLDQTNFAVSRFEHGEINTDAENTIKPVNLIEI